MEECGVVEVRNYYADREIESVKRIWREVGRIDHTELQASGVVALFEGGRSRVAVLDGSAECAVHQSEGLIRYLDEDLDVCVISAVAVNRIARRIGVESSMTAEALASGANEGAEAARSACSSRVSMIVSGSVAEATSTGSAHRYSQVRPTTRRHRRFSTR
jgi:hypothetical protein